MSKSNGDVLLKKLYPKIADKMKNSTYKNKYKQCISKFIENRSKELYDTAPYSRMYFGKDDANELFNAFGISELEVANIIKETYYGKIANFNPAAAKDPFTIILIMVLRYYHLLKKTNSKEAEKGLELTCIYLSFSGKFYPSIHFGSFPTVEPSEYPHVMDYVVNNLLTQKFDLKREGTVIGAVRSIADTWLEAYEDLLDSFQDDDIVYIIQQLHDRMKSFMINIAKLYYKTYEDKDHVFTYDSDDMSEENYRIADNDSMKIDRAVESTMSYINNTTVDYNLCKLASDNNVRRDEVKSIIESILNDSNNVSIMKELIRCIITDYYMNNKNPDLRNYDFIRYSISPKPNSKLSMVNKQKEIIENWLEANSPAYHRRKSRNATKSSYFKALTTYFVLLINKANK